MTILGFPHFHRPKEKPKIWGPPDKIYKAVRDWCENKLATLPSMIIPPFWEGAGKQLFYFVDGKVVFATINNCEWIAKQLELTVANTSYIDFPTVSRPNLPIALCVNGLTANSVAQYNRIFSSCYDKTNYYDIWMNIATGGNLQISYGDGGPSGSGSRRTKTSTATLSVGNEYNVASVVRGSGDMSLYADGDDYAGSYSGTGGSLAHGSVSARIGMDYDVSSFYSEIDISGSVLLFDVNLSPDQIALINDRPNEMFEPVSRPSYFFAPSVEADTDLFDGKIIIKNSATDLLDGKVIVKDIDTDLLDGKVLVQNVDTDLLDGKVIVKDIAINLLDGKVAIKNVATDLLDGKVVIETAGTDLLDGKVIVKDVATNLLDGKIIVQSDGTDLLDGKVIVGNIATGLLDGKIIIGNKATNLLDGKVVISAPETTATNLLDGKLIISIGTLANGTVTIQFTGKSPSMTFTEKASNIAFTGKKPKITFQ